MDFHIHLARCMCCCHEFCMATPTEHSMHIEEPHLLSVIYCRWTCTMLKDTYPLSVPMHCLYAVFLIAPPGSWNTLQKPQPCGSDTDLPRCRCFLSALTPQCLHCALWPLSVPQSVCQHWSISWTSASLSTAVRTSLTIKLGLLRCMSGPASCPMMHNELIHQVPRH